MLLPAFRELALAKLEELITDVKDLKRQNRQILGQIGIDSAVIIHKYPPLPLKSTVELDSAETAIRDPEQFQKLVSRQH